MNREKRDKIPSMQVSFIDAICVQLYEVIWTQLFLSFPSSDPNDFQTKATPAFSVIVVFTDLGWLIRALLPSAGRVSEKPAALEASG